MDKVMVLVIDGCAPEYLTKKNAPNLYRLSQKYGFIKRIQGAMPSVTNVNHACILSGKWPEKTGITGNYFYDRQSGCEGFVEEKGHMKAQTILQHYQKSGKKTALLTVKGKILGVYGEGADIGLSLEAPDDSLLKRYRLKPAPALQSISSSEWIVEAAYRCIQTDNPDFVYCTTNDYIFHHFAPGCPEADEQISAIDRWVEKIYSMNPKRQIYVTADHGMNQKTTIFNFPYVAAKAGFSVYCLPPLKDRYIENHIYQEGGMLYIYLNSSEAAADFQAFAQSRPEIETVLTKEEAAERYHLPIDQIGDFVLFSAKDYAFGEIAGELLHTNDSRTHGSLYEREIPLIAINPIKESKQYNFSMDIVKYLLEPSQ